MLLTQSPASPVILWFPIVLLTVHVLWQLGTGRTRMRRGTPVYRKDNPRLFWASVSFEIGGICLCLIGLWRHVYR
jgi:hypothetical protein